MTPPAAPPSAPRPPEPGPWTLARTLHLTQDSEKGLAGLIFDDVDGERFCVAIPFQALVDALMPLVGDWTPPQ